MQDPREGAPFTEPLTDAQVAALNATDKAKLIEGAVTEAINQYLARGPVELNDQEKLLLMAFKRWMASTKSASGVFHYRLERV